MGRQNVSLSKTDEVTASVGTMSEQNTDRSSSQLPPAGAGGKRFSVAGGWHDRLVESGLILSLLSYYLVGNPNIRVHIGNLAALNPLLSLPFLLLFVLLCWYRLPFAVALLPLTLPYYLLQKTVMGSYKFSLAEIMLWTCLAVALVQLLLRRPWREALSWSSLRVRIGPFLFPIVIFALAALASIFIAYKPMNALRALREEVAGPLLYLALALVCLRTRQDVTRLLTALFGTGLIIVLLGIVQFYFFKNTIVADAAGLHRITTVYGSANNISLLIDYTLPIGLALVLARVAWQARLGGLLCCLPFFFVLSQSDSRGGWLIAIPLAVLFILACSIRNRKVLLIGTFILLLLGSTVFALYHTKIYDTVLNGHASQHLDGKVESSQSTVTKRLYLWQSALNMIHDSPWLGYGLDNWLCHYSNDWKNACLYTAEERLHHPQQVVGGLYQPGPTHPKLPAYWIVNDPKTGAFTGLSDEPNLSHPHNIFLHVWVSIGLFGLLAFVAVLILFYWLFARLLWFLDRAGLAGGEWVRWLVVAVGACMLAALIQGQVDSAFLEQDLAFCFWTLVTALLLLRASAAMPWRTLVSNRISSVRSG